MWGPTAPAEHTSQLDLIDKIIKIVAVFVGAGWVYLNYLRGRTFKHRLEPMVSGKTIRNKGVLLLSGLAQVKNVGLSQVPIEQRGTAVEVLQYVLSDTQTEAPALPVEVLTARSVFEAHGWIEPGEQVEESFLIPVPEGPATVAFRLRLRIVSAGIEWNGDSIVEIAPPDMVVEKSHSPYSTVIHNTETDRHATDIENKRPGSGS